MTALLLMISSVCQAVTKHHAKPCFALREGIQCDRALRYTRHDSFPRAESIPLRVQLIEGKVSYSAAQSELSI